MGNREVVIMMCFFVFGSCFFVVFCFYFELFYKIIVFMENKQVK